MKNDSYWNLFEKTGNINDYLSYACTSEESVCENRVKGYSIENIQDGLEQFIALSSKIREEGENGDRPGNRHGNGSFCYGNWRL